MSKESDGRTTKQVLESMSQGDELIDHDIEECGHCFTSYLMAQVARDMVKAGDTGKGALRRWGEEWRKRWQEGKYYRLYQEEQAAGREPKKAFEDRGWEM